MGTWGGEERMARVNPEAELPFRETAHLFNSLCIIPTVLKLCEMKDGKYPLEEPYPPRGGDPITYSLFPRSNDSAPCHLFTRLTSFFL